MMLAGIRAMVCDGARTTLIYSDKTVDTYVGKAPTADTLKHFLVSPVDCEIAGCAETPDGKAWFINIQHPVETITSVKVTDPGNFLSH